MMIRLVIVVVMALSVLGFGGIALIAMHQPTAASAPAPHQETTVAVLVASRPLHAGTLLHPQDLATRDFPLSAVPPGALRSMGSQRNDLNGALLRVTIPTGGLILPPDLVQPGDHGYLAAVLSPGKRAVSIGVDAVSGVAGLIWPGDDVDLILTQSFDDPGVPAGRRMAAKTVLSALRVIATDQDLVRGERPDSAGLASRTVTLEATPDQAQAISIANRLGKLSLSVRSIESDQQAALPPAAAAVVTWSSDISPLPGPGTSTGTIHVFNGATETKDYQLP